MESDCFYCGSKPSLDTISSEGWKRNGIDRIDSSKGYTLDNVVPCCSKCNMAKRDMSQLEFYKHIDKLHKHLVLTGRINE